MGEKTMTIYKYDVPVKGEATVDMPEGARVLSVGLQGSSPKIWALVDPRAPMRPRRFAWRGTGHPATDVADERFIGTVHLLEGEVVAHLFERKE